MGLEISQGTVSGHEFERRRTPMYVYGLLPPGVPRQEDELEDAIIIQGASLSRRSCRHVPRCRQHLRRRLPSVVDILLWAPVNAPHPPRGHLLAGFPPATESGGSERLRPWKHQP